MGTWGHRSFENDDALDFVNFLVDSHDLKWIHDTFKVVLDSKRPIEDDDGAMAIAASEVVAFMRGHPADDLPEDVLYWHEEHRLSVDDQLVENAIQVTEKVLAKSGLYDLWEGDPEWQASVQGLLKRLKAKAVKKKQKKLKKRIRYKIGDIVKILLEDGYHTYARVVTETFIVYYDLRIQENIDDMNKIIEKPVLFVLCSHDTAIKDGRWPIVGHVSLEEKPFSVPDQFMQDIADPTDLRILRYPATEIPAAYEECEGLERAAVWAVNHVEDRLNDHFAGRENGVVERLKLKRF